jgi:cytochrome c oxidase subunit 2
VPFSHLFDQVFALEAGIASAVALVVVGILVFACVRYRARPGSERAPSHRHEWTIVEGSYVFAVAGMAVFLVWLSLSNMSKEQNASDRRPAITVLVTGFQWCWRFSYLHLDSTVQGTCTDGTRLQDLPTLVLPRNEPVRFDITSNDVIHEFWLPYVDMKWEAFPNHVSDYTATFPRDGRWLGHCSEFCGLLHADMLFWVKVESPSAYRHWLAQHHGFHVE